MIYSDSDCNLCVLTLRSRFMKKILIQSPIMTNAAAMNFHNCNGSPKNIVALNMPNTGTSNVNGAITVAGYLASNLPFF